MKILTTWFSPTRIAPKKKMTTRVSTPAQASMRVAQLIWLLNFYPIL